MEDDSIAPASEPCSVYDNDVYICQDCGEAFSSFHKLMGHNLLLHIDDAEWFVEVSDGSRHTSLKFCSDISSHFQREFESQPLMAESTIPGTTNVHPAEVEGFANCAVLLNPKIEDDYLQPLDNLPLKEAPPKKISAKLRKKNSCSFCMRSFNSSYSLKVHLRVHSGEKPYACQHCGFRFTQKGNLETHLRKGACLKAVKETAVEEVKVVDVQGSYEDACENSVENYEVNDEAKQKRSSAVLACKTCGKRFPSNSLLVMHERIHSGERPFNCHFCGIGFTQKGNRNKHIRRGICRRSKDNSAYNSVAMQSCKTHESKGKNADRLTRGLLNSDTIPKCPEEKSENTDGTLDDENVHDQQLGEVSAAAYGSVDDENLKLPLPVSGICTDDVGDSSQSFDCEHCGRHFQRNSSLVEHMRIHLNLKPFVCAKCGARFRQNGHLHRHERSSGCPGRKPDKPKQADNVLVLSTENSDYASILRQKAGLELRNDNLVAESSLNGLDGSLLKEITDSESAMLLNDISPHINGTKCSSHKARSPLNVGPYICSVCDKQFTRNRNLQVHMRLHTGERPYSCHLCTESFPFREHLKRHVFLHEEANSNFISKPGRPSKGDAVNNLSQQSYTGSDFVTPRYFCAPCQRAFKTKERLDNHVRTHTGEKPFVCSVCSRAFTTRQTLSIHLRMHTGELPYMCSFCARRFRQLANLNKHVRAMHVRERKHACTQCSLRFREREHLLMHIRSVHSDERPFVCDICGKGFALSNNLRLHVQSHQGIKRHACPTCGKCFTLQKHMRKHEQTHLKVKRFKCEVCSKQFSDAYYFRKHMQQHNTVSFVCEHCGEVFSRRCKYVLHLRMHDADDPRSHANRRAAQPEGFVESFGLGAKDEQVDFVGIEVTVDDIGETC